MRPALRTVNRDGTPRAFLARDKRVIELPYGLLIERRHVTGLIRLKPTPSAVAS